MDKVKKYLIDNVRAKNKGEPVKISFCLFLLMFI